MATDTSIIQRHNEDVIFSNKSLEEFIRLIQRQGINNLTIYAVNDLLSGASGQEKYTKIKTRKPPPTYTTANWPTEFTFDEIKDKRNYFVFVRYSFSWEAGGETKNGVYTSKNEKNGRHVFVKTVNDIKFYAKYNNGVLDTSKSSLFHEVVSNQSPLPDIFSGNASYMKNGTFTITIDNIQDVVKIKGFNDNGEYIGKVKVDTTGMTEEQITATKAKFLRGDGNWSNILQGPLQLTNVGDVQLGDTDVHGLTIGPTITSASATCLQIDQNEIMVQCNGTTATLNIQLQGGNTAIGSPKIYSTTHNTADLGKSNSWWANVYTTNLISKNVTIGSATTPTGSLIINGNEINTTKINQVVNGDGDAEGSAAHFWRCDGTWANQLNGSFIINSTSGVTGSNIPSHTNDSAFRCYGAGIFSKNLSANKVFNAVFNDYAEYRATIDLEPGRVVRDNDDGTLSCTNGRLIPGAQIISDTFGHSMGYNEQNQTPLAVAGRVLAYPYQPREKYHAGMAVCSGPNGTVDIMTREEIKEYPDCIVGIVSEIPQYEKWGTDQVKVNGRIWIKVK